MLRVLITNDDGIGSEGLKALAAVAHDRGHDAFVAAPSRDNSGASASVAGVTHGRDLAVERHTWPGWAPDAVLSVNATPALICRSALKGAFGPPPDVVLSGINRGANTGRAILHSGTVGAALTAYLEGRPALAVSLAVADPVDSHGAHWAAAAITAGRLFDWLTSEMRHLVLNCNVPNVPPGELRGIRVGRLAPVGTSQASVTEDTGRRLPLTVGAAVVHVHADGPHPEGRSGPPTDMALLEDGYASVTAVVPVIEDPDLELTTVLGPDLLSL